MKKYPTESQETRRNHSSERQRIAESPSLYSDTFLRVYHPQGAFANIAAYGALLFYQEERYWETDKEVKYFGSLCYKFNYEGKWRTFQEILEKTTSYQEYEVVCKEIFGTHTYYGNLIPLIQKYKTTILAQSRTQKGHVKKPKRKRGYNDHGSLRPYHQRGRNLPGSEEIREDRRSKIAHPLLKGEDFFGGVEVPTGHVPQILTSEDGEEK